MPKGNPNPSPATRFKPGQSGNPSGRSTEEQLAHQEAAKIAAKLKLKALSSLQDKISKEETTEKEIREMLFNPDVQRMFKEAEDRAHGSPKAAVDLTNSDGSLSNLTDDQLQARLSALRKASSED